MWFFHAGTGWPKMQIHKYQAKANSLLRRKWPQNLRGGAWRLQRCYSLASWAYGDGFLISLGFSAGTRSDGPTFLYFWCDECLGLELVMPEKVVILKLSYKWNTWVILPYFAICMYFCVSNYLRSHHLITSLVFKLTEVLDQLLCGSQQWYLQCVGCVGLFTWHCLDCGIASGLRCLGYHASNF